MNVDHSYRTPKSGLHQSQHGEDIWLDEYFQRKVDGYFVEVGAYDGVVLSNTFFFETSRNWTGVLVEPDAVNAESCKARRARSKTFQCAAARPGVSSINFTQVQAGGVYSTTSLNQIHERRIAEYGLKHTTTTVPAQTLDQILELAGAPRGDIDLVSIDVEEAEMDVLSGFSLLKWRPTIVVIESNSSTRQPDIRDYFVRNGYAYLRSIAVNDFYVPVLGGRLFARWVDARRYRLAKRPVKPFTGMAAFRRMLDRHVLWRFRKQR